MPLPKLPGRKNKKITGNKNQEVKKKKIVAISGSNRKNSSNEKLIKFISEISADLFEISLFDISSLPYFTQDIDNSNVPGSVIKFRKAIEEANGVLICTPEYVFSIPGILK